MHVYHSAPAIILLALFPAFFAYHAMIALGFTTPFLPGGGWTALNCVGALVLAPLALFQAWQSRTWVLHAVVAVLGAWIAAYALYFHNYGTELQRDPVLLREAGQLLIGWISLYALGYLLKPSARLAMVLVCALAGMAATAVFLLDPSAIRAGKAGIASHQWYAQAVAFTAIFAVAVAPTLRLQTAAVLLTWVALYAIGALSELVGFALVTVLWMIVTAWKLNWRVPVLAASLAIVYALGGSPADATSPEHQEPSSWEMRSLFLERGIEDIKTSPLLGDYGAQMRGPGGMQGRFGRFGAYIHNGLSAWQQFGLIPFLIYAGLCVAPAAVAAWFILRRGADDAMWMSTLYVGAFTLFLVLGAKAVFWSLPALAGGLLAQMLSDHATSRRARAWAQDVSASRPLTLRA